MVESDDDINESAKCLVCGWRIYPSTVRDRKRAVVERGPVHPGSFPLGTGLQGFRGHGDKFTKPVFTPDT